MCALNRIFSAGVLVAIVAILAGGNAVAQGAYVPSADTYTDLNAPDANHGADQHLLLSASNLAGCVETTYLWFKFDIPSAGSTIADASLALTLGPGAGTVDLELRSSADTSWSETGLTWSNQPALDPNVLATAAGATPGSTATFRGAALTAYLNARQGQTVSLLVRADCDGVVSTSVALALQAREHPDGSGATLTLTHADTRCPDFEAPLGIVGVEDVQAVAGRWRDPGQYEPQYDVVYDEAINILDIMTVAAQLGPCP
jgi:hypothetical protein